MSNELNKTKVLIKLLSVENASDFLEVMLNPDLGVSIPEDLDVSSLNELEKKQLLSEIEPQIGFLKHAIIGQIKEEIPKELNKKLANMEKVIDIRIELGSKMEKEILFKFYNELKNVGFTEEETITLIKKINLNKLLSNNSVDSFKMSDLFVQLTDNEIENFKDFLNDVFKNNLNLVIKHEFIKKLSIYIKNSYDEYINVGFNSSTAIDLTDINLERL